MEAKVPPTDAGVPLVWPSFTYGKYYIPEIIPMDHGTTQFVETAFKLPAVLVPGKKVFAVDTTKHHRLPDHTMIYGPQYIAR